MISCDDRREFKINRAVEIREGTHSIQYGITQTDIHLEIWKNDETKGDKKLYPKNSGCICKPKKSSLAFAFRHRTLIWRNRNVKPVNTLDFSFPSLYFRIWLKNKIKMNLILGSRQAG